MLSLLARVVLKWHNPLLTAARVLSSRSDDQFSHAFLSVPPSFVCFPITRAPRLSSSFSSDHHLSAITAPYSLLSALCSLLSALCSLRLRGLQPSPAASLPAVHPAVATQRCGAVVRVVSSHQREAAGALTLPQTLLRARGPLTRNLKHLTAVHRYLLLQLPAAPILPRSPPTFPTHPNPPFRFSHPSPPVLTTSPPPAPPPHPSSPPLQSPSVSGRPTCWTSSWASCVRPTRCAQK